MGLLMRNGIEYSGGGGSESGDVNVYGAFIDTNKVLAQQIQFFTSMTYTAPQDCYITFYLVGANGSDIQIKIDTKLVYEAYYNAVYGDSTALFLKKGQAISVTGASSQYESYYTVYELVQGTNNIFTPVIYSDEERCIGVWRDNKPLYQKTLNISPTNSSSLLSVDVSSLNIDNCIDVQGYSIRNASGNKIIYFASMEESSNYMFWARYDKSTGNLRYKSWYSDSTCDAIYITLRYTKTTDVAGSGSWNTDGVPTHHYSTTEQVIGTWIDGKPLYERTYEGTTSASSAVTVMIDLGTGMVIRRFDGTIGGRGLNSYYEAGHFNRMWIGGNGYQLAYLPNGSEFLSQPYNVTIQYTKTTD